MDATQPKDINEYKVGSLHTARIEFSVPKDYRHKPSERHRPGAFPQSVKKNLFISQNALFV